MRIPDDDIIVTEARYLLYNQTTLRKASEYFGRSKSTIHTHMRKRLPLIHKALATEVAKLLDFNRVDRTVRGGIATKEKYAMMRRKLNGSN